MEKSKPVIALKSLLVAMVATATMYFAINISDSVEITVRPESIQVKIDNKDSRCLIDPLPLSQGLKG